MRDWTIFVSRVADRRTAQLSTHCTIVPGFVLHIFTKAGVDR